MERFSQCENVILLVIISVVSRLKDCCNFLTITGRVTRLHHLGVVIVDAYEEDF